MSFSKNQEELKGSIKNIHQELIDGCKQGDQKAMVELYKLYFKSMYNTSLRIVRDTGDAEDVMQDSFLDAFQKIDQYDERATFGAWLKRIVINKSLDQLKRNKGNVSYEEVNPEILPETQEDHLEVLSYQVEQIRKAIDSLPDDYRIIISLYLLEGYDHEEISKILDISYENTRTRYSRAKKRLIHDLHSYKINEAV